MTEPYRTRSAETWVLARDDYLSGLSAEVVCRRHGLGLSAFRQRARKDGWRRVDQPDPAPEDLDLTLYDDVDADEQIEMARLRFVRALERGQAVEAMRWRRLWQTMSAELRAINADFFTGMTPDQIIEIVTTQPDDRANRYGPSHPPDPA